MRRVAIHCQAKGTHNAYLEWPGTAAPGLLRRMAHAHGMKRPVSGSAADIGLELNARGIFAPTSSFAANTIEK